MTAPSSRRRLSLPWAAAAGGAVVVALGASGVGGGAEAGLAPVGVEDYRYADPSRAGVGDAPVADRPFGNAGHAPQDSVSFAEDVLPIFQARCAECHGGADENGEVRTEVSLNLIEYERVIMGSEFGTVIEPGDPEGSWLLEMVVAGDMPETGDPLTEEQIAVIRTWIAAGAPNN